MRKLTRMELWVAVSWLLLICSCGFAVIMAGVMRNLFFVMYSDRLFPRITEFFLSADRWVFFVPLVPGIPAYLSWSRGRIEPNGPFLMAMMHVVTLIVMGIVAAGIMWPFLTTTWRM